MERRKFIKKSCLFCASIVASGTMLPFLAGCAPFKVLNIFPENGYVRVLVDKFSEENNLLILKNFDALNFDIAVVKYKNQTFRAFEMQCTHRPNVRLVATNNGFVCHEHGSRFDLNGQVTQAPAQKALKEFKLELINNHIIQITL